MKKRKIILVCAITAMLIATCTACGNSVPSHKANEVVNSVTETVTESQKTTTQVKPQDVKVEELTPLADNGVITGVKDITIEEGTDVNLNDLIYVDKAIVKGVDVDDSAVDYSKAGTYEVVYTITFDGDKLRDYVKDHHLTVNFNTDGNTIIVKTTVTVTIATEEEADTAIANGDTSIVTEETKTEVQKENKSKANSNAVKSTPAPATVTSQNSYTQTENTTSNSNDNNISQNNYSSSTSTGSTSDNVKKDDNPKKENSSTSSSSNSNNPNSSSANSSSNSNVSNNSKKDDTSTTPAHTHNYVETSRTNATCTASGSVTYTCSCGATKTEATGDALGHNMVHHNAVTHTENKLVKDAYDEPVYAERYVCNGCGAQFTDGMDAIDHVMAVWGDDCKNYSVKDVQVDTIHHDAVYETITVTDEAEYDVCDRCGYRE